MSDLAKTAHLWGENAKDWSEGIRDGLDVINTQFGLPFFVNKLPNLKGKTVLDAGCGEGRSTRAIATPESNIIGVDISKSMLEFARLEENKNPLGIQYIDASCHALEAIPSKSIDIITCYMSLMDMPDIDQVMREFSRVLNPQGEVFIMVRHPCFITPGFSIYSSKTSQRAGLTVSSYFENNTYIDKFSFPERPNKQFEIIRFPYTLTRYIESLRNANFLIHDLQEPTPPESLCAKQPRFHFWRKHAAIFLFIHGKLN